MVRCVKRRLQNAKILVLGLDNAGKTTIISTYLGGAVAAAPTFGYNIHTKKCNDCTITILDIGGQTAFKNFWSNYFESIDAVAFVLDCSDNRPVHDYIEGIRELSVPIALFCNKCDLNPSFRADIKDPPQRFRSFATSATQNIGVEEGFSWVIAEARGLGSCQGA